MSRIFLRDEHVVSGWETRLPAKAGLSGIEGDKEIAELGLKTSIDEVAQTIQENLSTE
jgi:hypothetical protein